MGHTEVGEYGAAALARVDGVECAGCGGTSALYGETPGHEQTVWMSHRDAVSRGAGGLRGDGRRPTCAPWRRWSAPSGGLYATQFHPEVRHTPYAARSCWRNFLFGDARDSEPYVDDGLDHRRCRGGDSGAGGRATRVILGAFRRRGLVRGGGAVREGDRQAAGVRVREPRTAAQETSPRRSEAVFTKQFDVDFVHVHAEDRYAAACWRASTEPGGEAPHHRRAVLGGVLPPWHEEVGRGDGRTREVPGAGHDLPRHHRERRAQDRRQGVHHQEPPQPDPLPRWRFVST